MANKQKNLLGFLMPSDKRGQGMSLNVVIIAALALIVLVVLVMIFTGRIAIFERGVGSEAKAELQALKTFYGECHPSAFEETAFITRYTEAAAEDNVEEANIGKTEAKSDFQNEINNCKSYGGKSLCESSECDWG